MTRIKTDLPLRQHAFHGRKTAPGQRGGGQTFEYLRCNVCRQVPVDPASVAWPEDLKRRMFWCAKTQQDMAMWLHENGLSDMAMGAAWAAARTRGLIRDMGFLPRRNVRHVQQVEQLCREHPLDPKGSCS